jgi:DNA-binding IclR family transcriptional regulator
MSVSTAHRYCSALRKAGLLRYDPATGRYGLGGGCIELGLAAAEAMPIVGLARPLMSEVVAHLDRTAVLGVWDEDSVRVLEVNDHTSAPARITVRIGAQLGVFETAQGLLYLTFSRRVRQRFADSPELERPPAGSRRPSGTAAPSCGPSRARAPSPARPRRRSPSSSGRASSPRWRSSGRPRTCPRIRTRRSSIA